MLAHFENFNLAALLENFDVSHVFLLYLLDGHLFISLFVHCELDQAKLALPQRLVLRIKVEHIRVASGLVEPLDPLTLVLLLREENKS